MLVRAPGSIRLGNFLGANVVLEAASASPGLGTQQVLGDPGSEVVTRLYHKSVRQDPTRVLNNVWLFVFECVCAFGFVSSILFSSYQVLQHLCGSVVVEKEVRFVWPVWDGQCHPVLNYEGGHSSV